VKDLLYPALPDILKIIVVWKFPKFACFSFYEQHVDKDEYGAMVE
jgi:hypothetical protein